MKTKNDNSEKRNSPDRNPKNPNKDGNSTKKEFPGYPHYPASEDIYSNEDEVDINPENLPEDKDSNDPLEPRNTQNIDEDLADTDPNDPSSEENPIRNKLK